jgi:hypothetical protein
MTVPAGNRSAGSSAGRAEGAFGPPTNAAAHRAEETTRGTMIPLRTVDVVVEQQEVMALLLQ